MDFGFTINKSSRIDLDTVDKDKFSEIVAEEPDVLKCIACGSCTASCTAGKFRHTSVRSAILALQNGKSAQALNLLEGCMLCGKCLLVCPRGINTRHLIISILKVYGNK